MSLIKIVQEELEQDFTVIPNYIIRSGILTPAQIGYYCYLMSHRDSWGLTVKSVSTLFGLHKDTVSAYNKVLKENDLMHIRKLSTGGTEWHMFRTQKKCREFRESLNPEKPDQAKKALSRKNPDQEKTLIPEKPGRIKKTNSFKKTKEIKNIISLEEEKISFSDFDSIGREYGNEQWRMNRFVKFKNYHVASSSRARTLAQWKGLFANYLANTPENEKPTSFNAKKLYNTIMSYRSAWPTEFARLSVAEKVSVVQFMSEEERAIVYGDKFVKEVV